MQISQFAQPLLRIYTEVRRYSESEACRGREISSWPRGSQDSSALMATSGKHLWLFVIEGVDAVPGVATRKQIEAFR
jgi:hypothetical protein